MEGITTVVITAIVTAAGTHLGGKLMGKLTKKDCSDCVTVKELKAEIENLKSTMNVQMTAIKTIVLHIATAVNADVKDYEGLVK